MTYFTKCRGFIIPSQISHLLCLIAVKLRMFVNVFSMAKVSANEVEKSITVLAHVSPSVCYKNLSIFYLFIFIISTGI